MDRDAQSVGAAAVARRRPGRSEAERRDPGAGAQSPGSRLSAQGRSGRDDEGLALRSSLSPYTAPTAIRVRAVSSTESFSGLGFQPSIVWALAEV